MDITGPRADDRYLDLGAGGGGGKAPEPEREAIVVTLGAWRKPMKLLKYLDTLKESGADLTYSVSTNDAGTGRCKVQGSPASIRAVMKYVR